MAYGSSKDRYYQILPRWQEQVAGRMDTDDAAVRDEVLFSCHSCAIEGNSYSVDDIHSLKELNLGFVPKGKTLVETMEMLDHFHAYEYMQQAVSKARENHDTPLAPLTEDYVKHLHYLLTEHTRGYLHEGAHPGEYTDTDMCADNTIFGDHADL